MQWEMVQGLELGGYAYGVIGMALWGLVSRLLVWLYGNKILKQAKNMAKTSCLPLKTLCKRYENRLHMDLTVHNIYAFVDKYMWQIRVLGIPIFIWKSMTLNSVILSVMFAGLGVVDSIYRGYSQEAIVSLLNITLIASALLLSAENIFSMEGLMERIRSELTDYLDNELRNRIGKPLVLRRKTEVEATQIQLENMTKEQEDLPQARKPYAKEQEDLPQARKPYAKEQEDLPQAEQLYVKDQAELSSSKIYPNRNIEGLVEAPGQEQKGEAKGGKVCQERIIPDYRYRRKGARKGISTEEAQMVSKMLQEYLT